MNSLGIYFGPKFINIVETKKDKLLNNIQIPQSVISPRGLEEQVPPEVKLTAVFKDELRRNKIEVNKAVFCLSGKDLIIRTFEMPMMPREEAAAAVSFEAKKYIPFKVEELIFDYQIQVDRVTRKNSVLFVGIKKETIDKYVSLARQLNIKIVDFEYSAFSLLRAVKLIGAEEKGIVAVLGVDLKEDDEANFSVFENGFPLFSRDFSLSGGLEELGRPQTHDSAKLIDKLKNEIRFSFDYYQRKFLNKGIKKVIFMSDPELTSELSVYLSEMNYSVKAIEFSKIAKVMNKPAAYSLSMLKGYSAALAEEYKKILKIDLLAAQEKIKAAPKDRLQYSLLEGIKVDPKIVFAGLLICLVTYGYGFYRMHPLHKAIDTVVGMRAQVAGVSPTATIEQLNQAEAKYRKKLNNLDKTVKNQLFATTLLNIISSQLPDGVWLDDL
ncbi:MAG: pilus assembly protein PilM, partial [Candidatus Omnitrophota bacterium]